VDKENQKERDKARRQFNELVRRLAKHVKGMDPRAVREMARAKEEREERVCTEKKEEEGERSRKKEEEE
jgi:hypothetical protein